jgi:hypothetical protein
MGGVMNKCEKCGFMHYRTDPCRAAKPIVAMDFGVEPPSVHIDPKPKRSGNRHKPGYFTEYMRDYRKGIRRSKAKGINPKVEDKPDII